MTLFIVLQTRSYKTQLIFTPRLLNTSKNGSLLLTDKQMFEGHGAEQSITPHLVEILWTAATHPAQQPLFSEAQEAIAANRKL